ncbi:MAG: PAS domain-containing protein, partial [Granulosicoccus sp.]
MSRLTLRFQIGLSFTVLILLLIISSATGFLGLRSEHNGLVEYRNLAKDTNLSNEVLSELSSIRLLVKDYLFTHNPQKLVEFNERLESIQSYLKMAQSDITDSARGSIVAEIIRLKNEYAQAFMQIVEFVEKENLLYEEELHATRIRMRKTLGSITLISYDENDSHSMYLAARAEEQLLVGGLYMARFISRRDAESHRRMQQEININLQQGIDDLAKALTKPASQRLFEDLKQDNTYFLAGIKRLHKLVTSRDALVNDRLDVIGPEIARLAADVKLSVERSQDTLGTELQASGEKSLLTGAIISIGAVLIACLLAVFLFRAVWRPLGAEPRTLLDVINRIASGDLHNPIEGQNEEQSGVFAGVLSMRQQLADQMAREREAASENARIRQALENSATNVIVTDADDQIMFVNKAAVQLFQQLQGAFRSHIPNFDSQSLVGQNISVFDNLFAGSAEFLHQATGTATYELVVGDHELSVTANTISSDFAGQNHASDVQIIGVVFEWLDKTDAHRQERAKTAAQARERDEAEQIRSKVDQILTVVDAASTGDLTLDINVSGDDAIGRVGQRLQRFFADLSDNMRSLGDTAGALRTSSHALSSINNNLNESAVKTSTEADVVSSSSEQVNDNVNSVATAAVQMSASVREIAKSAADAANVANEAVDLAESTD